MFKCGFYESDITPKLGFCMPGQFNDRPSKSVKDNLFAHAYAFTDGVKTVIMISLDTIVIDARDVKRMRKGINSVTGVSCENIYIAAIHSHTAGPVSTLYNTERNEEYIEFLIGRVVDAGIVAFNRMAPAKLGYASTDVRGVAFNRRWVMSDGRVQTNPRPDSDDIVLPADVTDPQLIVVRIDNEDGSPMGVITNFALHLDCVGGDSFSADYPGVIRNIIKSKYGYDCGFMFLNGCCGNINHIDFVNAKRRTYKEIGEILAASVIDLFDKIETSADISVDVDREFITAEIRLPTAEEIANPTFHHLIVREMKKALEMGGGEIECEIMSIALGDLAFTGLPGEMFCIFGHMVKNGSPYKMNIVSELTNAQLGYVYTREAKRLGGYESTASTYTRLNEEAGYLMVGAAIKNLRKMIKR
ncbi:MAG: hypothetical protein GX633_00025 [Clostridiales bacterium]|nr:hypothetical protein [Clostridiales bacterium]